MASMSSPMRQCAGFCNRLSIGLSIDRFAGLAGRLADAKADVVAA
jgi:hypothetical protein